MPSERSIVGAISRWLTRQKIWHMKVHGSAYQRAGIPDIIGCARGRFFGLEVKRPGEHPTKIQRYELGKLDKAGALTAVVRSVEDAQDVFKDILI